MANILDAQTNLTLADFRNLAESNQSLEFIHGEVFMPPAPKDWHQASAGNSFILVSRLIKNGILRFAPTDVYLGENVVQPDVFWVSDANLVCKLGEDGYWYGAPDLVIEVLSPATAARDRGVKFDLYEAAGVLECWLLDPDGKYVEVYRLQTGAFVRQGVYATGETFTSSVLGDQPVQVDTLFRK
jgi:Uma2 family endonuclease